MGACFSGTSSGKTKNFKHPRPAKARPEQARSYSYMERQSESTKHTLQHFGQIQSEQVVSKHSYQGRQPVVIVNSGPKKKLMTKLKPLRENELFKKRLSIQRKERKSVVKA
eukprot:TRINITY_DN5470_c0_g1_i1.p1 TRINITY_DN5470_c0_g1~~TRINITY_DN5470_c0_g1_i1.p1  ORF type:complete len:111 (+),score=15.14 TRINITY_DN5470_c0_g1_i1:99-431(+)